MRSTVSFSAWIVRMATASCIPRQYSLADRSLMKGRTRFLGQSCHSEIEVDMAMADGDVGWVLLARKAIVTLTIGGVAPAKMIVGSLVVSLLLALTMLVQSPLARVAIKA